MRSNQQNKRSRGRNNNHNRNKNANPMTRSYESNGPDVRVRGNAAHVAEKYVQLARDANSSGDSVAAENYLQHAEHYNRIISAAQAQQLAQQQAQAARAEQQQQRQNENRGDKVGDVQPNIGSQGTENAQQGEAASSEDGAGMEKGSEGILEQAQAKSKRAPRERRPRRRPVAEKPAVAVAQKSETVPVDAVPADAVPADATEPMNDPANAPQPDVSELPAFVTAEVDNSAVE